MDYLNSRNLGFLAIALIVVGIVGLVLVIFAGAKDYVGVASAILIAGAAIFTAAVKFHSEERDRAFKLLNEYAAENNVFDALGFIGRTINKNETISFEMAKKIYVDGDGSDRDLVAKIFFVYNFFEEIAIGVRHKQINERIVYQFWGGMLCRCYVATSVFIPVARNFPDLIDAHPFSTVQRPDMFVNVDWLYERWKPYYKQFFPPANGEIPAVWARTGRTLPG